MDLRYQGHRMRSRAAEARLLASIAERGIEQPLEGVDTPQGRFLLNGFKRYRCAGKLGISCVPYTTLGDEEAMGIVALMRVAKDQTLNLLEEAKFISELLTVHRMSPAEIAEKLGRSKGWVGMRRNLLEEMSEEMERILFRGAFPAYSYMYTLRPFMRMNSAGKESVERFMKALAGRRLSVRDIELLAQGYFRGPASLREAVDEGKWSWSLEQMKRVPEDPEGCNDFERALLRDLEMLQKCIRRLMVKCHDERLQSRDFHAQANLLAASLLSKLEPFFNTMREFHDRTGQA
ncbi:MAG: ParB/RepB/Spo0J family partition protein [Planctomycetota bacterium]